MDLLAISTHRAHLDFPIPGPTRDRNGGHSDHAHSIDLRRHSMYCRVRKFQVRQVTIGTADRKGLQPLQDSERVPLQRGVVLGVRLVCPQWGLRL